MSQMFCTIDYQRVRPERTYEVSEVLLTMIDLNDYLRDHNMPDLVSLGTAGIDAADVRRIVNDLGLTGRAYVKMVDGRAYLILKGVPGQRPVLRGTRYLASNPSVAHLVTTPRKLAAAVVRSNVLSLIAYTTIEVAEAILRNPDPRLTTLMGRAGANVLKFAAASAAGFLAGVVAGTITTLAAGPVLAAVFVGLASAVALEFLDSRFQLTEKLIAALEAVAANRPRPLEWLANEIERWNSYLLRQAVNNIPRP